MEKSSISLAGVFPPIPTPFDDDGNISFPALVANLERWHHFALAGYVISGSNGEGPYLTADERIALFEAARPAIPRDRLLIAGTGCESTRETIALTCRAAAAGADAALVVTPHYYAAKMTADLLVRHYQAVADASPIPILIYNVPKFTHVNVDPAAIARAAQHPNIVGMKDTSGDITQLAYTIRLAGPGFQLLAGSAGFFFAALALGAVGGILALANIAPLQSLEIYRLFKVGAWDQAADLQRRMIPVNSAITARFDIAGLKAALEMLGYYGGPVRPPLAGLTAGERGALRTILVEGGILP
ncbi:MAG TPA: dihydrodipicolinate synthase family protein [Anaerolineae bacterium]|nr:dihydrodipicolinate synthase family protein [Anaerolineae bacterium]